MTGGGGRLTDGSGARLLLVLMLAVGVVSMHALGHMAGGGMGMMPSATSAMHATAHAAGHAPAPAARSGSAARYRLADPGPMSVCLGLAGGAGLLVGCVLLRRARTFCCRGRAAAALGSGGAPLGEPGRPLSSWAPGGSPYRGRRGSRPGSGLPAVGCPRIYLPVSWRVPGP